MAVVTGTLRTFGLESLAGKRPVIVFEANKVGMDTNGELLARDPVRVTPAADDTFTARLAATDNLLTEGVHYKMWIEYLDPANNYVRFDNTDWTVQVPAAGGALGDLLAQPTFSSVLFITSPTPPPLWLGLGALWLQADPNDMDNDENPANTGDLYKLRNV